MREIKFRAWDNHKKQWIKEAEGFHVIGEVVAFGVIEQYCCDNKEESQGTLDYLGNILIVQYTGLKDSMGVEIYEGDIISVNGKYPKIIEYREDRASFCMVNISDLVHKDWKDVYCQINVCWWDDFNREVKVIGNIYENPELLKS